LENKTWFLSLVIVSVLIGTLTIVSTSYLAFGLSGTGSISGTKWNDQNDNGVRDPGEPGIGGVQICIVDENNVILPTPICTTTASDGSYSFTGLAAGTYRLQETVPTGSVQTFPAPTSGFNGCTGTCPGIQTVILETGSDIANNVNFGNHNPQSLTTLSDSVSVSDQVTAGIQPIITSMVAAGKAGDAGFFQGDTITVHFSQSTNEKFADSHEGETTSDLNLLFTCSGGLGLSCSTNLGTDFTGTWVDASTLVITGGSTAPGAAVGNLILTPILNSGLTNAAGTASVSDTPSPELTGSFAGPAPPTIRSFVIHDPQNGVNTFHSPDSFSIVFSEPTNEPGGTGLLQASAINNIFTFSPSLGSGDYNGSWVTPRLFNVTMKTVDNTHPAIIGTTTVQATGTGENGITNNAAPFSAASTSISPPLKGSFGTFSVTNTVAGGGTAVTTLPSGIILQTTIGSTSSETNTVSTTTAPTTGSGGSTLSFLGTPIDNSLPPGSCSNASECTFTFSFTCDDVTEANQNLPSSQQITYTNGIPNVFILHDRQHDGTFADSGDQLTTTVTQISHCLFLASAKDNTVSKFAIGGVAVLALLGKTSEASGAAPPTFAGSVFSSGEYPLTINRQGFKLDNYTNKITTSVFQVGKPVSLKLLIYELAGPDDIQGVSLITNLHETDLQVANSDTVLAYNNGSPPSVSDPHGFFKSVSITASPKNDKLEVDYNMTFAKPMPASNLIIRAWDKKDYKQDTTILNAFQVEDTMQTGQTQDSALFIPSWIKNTAKWWHDGNVDNTNFFGGVQYLVDHKMITIPQAAQSQTKSASVPPWVKNVAGWWADGSVSDDEFVKALQFLINNGIIKV
jgi:hypothetical protein